MKTALLVLLAALAPAALSAQGLGDTASRERQKREEKKAPVPARVYTNTDLPAPTTPPEAPPGEAGEAGVPGAADAIKPAEGAAAVPPGTGGFDPAPGAAGTAPAAVDPSEREREERKLLEAEWRVRFANAREQLAIAEANSWEEVVRTEYYQGIPVQMRVKEQVETAELRRARQALADLEEQFRRTGLPPGWAREN
jgi:hypothetical protein